MNVQSLSLMMLISMAYAASITMSPREAQKKALLTEIDEEVKEANKTSKNNYVHMAEPKQGYICEKCFFHYAEKALKGLKETSLHNLTRNLKGYIKTRLLLLLLKCVPKQHYNVGDPQRSLTLYK
ncbi:Hypothetical predicted protein [Scomber scombrus]|uniref:Uncharacterized protein n=1 Tax=Scomber scombrus TaxID=13677 RepID=A0AAV1NBW2_SCOSC